MKLGFIGRLQFKRDLNWQQRSRHVSFVITFCVSFMMFVPNSAHAAPITVEAENYLTMKGVVIRSTSDVGGGQNVGSINVGDWMTYSVVVPVTGRYKIIYRVATPNTTSKFILKSGADVNLASAVNLRATGGWQVWRDVEQTVTLQKGKQTLKIYSQDGSFNLNRFKIEKVADAVISSASASSVSSRAASSAPAAKPLPAGGIVIQAENYSAMSGIWNEITADVGGGKDAGEITTGDWMEYKNIEVLIPATTNYKITYRVASVSAVGRFTLHEAGGTAIFDTVPVPMTGAWQKWTSVERIVSLPAGKHYFGVKALSGAFNINWIKVESTVVTPPVVSSARSSSAPAVSLSSSSRSSTRAISSSSSSSKSSLSAVTHVTGPVEISWRAPTKRENGAVLYVDELGGYKIRYKKTTDTQYTYVSINNPWAQSYKFAWLEGDYIFQIAVFDKNGIYSLFENIRRQ